MLSCIKLILLVRVSIFKIIRNNPKVSIWIDLCKKGIKILFNITIIFCVLTHQSMQKGKIPISLLFCKWLIKSVIFEKRDHLLNLVPFYIEHLFFSIRCYWLISLTLLLLFTVFVNKTYLNLLQFIVAIN